MQTSSASHRSPVRVVVTPVGTAETRISSGRRHSAARSRSTELSENSKGQLSLGRDRDLHNGAYSRPLSARSNESSFLCVPGASGSTENVSNREPRKEDNSHSSDGERSRSASPFGIERERLPTGSPTFQKVLYEILSETEIESQYKDDLKTPKVKPPTNIRKKSPNTKTSRKRSSVSPSVHIRKTLFS